MKKRMVIMLVVVGVLLGGLVGFNFFKGYMMQKYMASAPIPASTVTAMTADYQQWQPQLAAAFASRFHQPPPSAWNSAAVSAKRVACACARASFACWYCR